MIASELNYEIEFKTNNFDALLLSLVNGDYDLVISAVTITEERKQFIDYTDAYVDENFEYDGEQMLASYAIALPKNSSLKNPFNEQIQSLKDNGTIRRLMDKYHID